MTEQLTEVFSLHFRKMRARKTRINEAYLALWIAYQRGALSADEFMLGLENDLLRNLDQLGIGWANSHVVTPASTQVARERATRVD